MAYYGLKDSSLIMSKDIYTLGKQQLLYKLAIHPVHRKFQGTHQHKFIDYTHAHFSSTLKYCFQENLHLSCTVVCHRSY